MSSPFLLSGEVDDRSEQIDSLREQVGDLEQQLSEAKREAMQAKAVIAALRRQLSPLHQALLLVFGEISKVTTDAATEEVQPKSNARWESWKKRMPGRPAEMIDLLLLHKSMSVKNLMAAMHCGKDSVYQAASKLGQAGIIVNNNGRYSLKETP